MVFSEDVKKTSAVGEFKELVKKAKAEHAQTPVALDEEILKELANVPENLTDSVIRNSLKRLGEEISERADEVTEYVDITKNELRELRGILAVKVIAARKKLSF